MKTAVCFGEVLWDNFPSGKKPGGAPMNVALHLLKNAVNSAVISSIGADPAGDELSSFLESQGLSTSYIHIHPTLPTGTVEVHLDEQQHATYDIIKPVAWDEIPASEELQTVVQQADAFIFGSLASRSEISRKTLFQLLDVARFKILDLNLRFPHYEEKTLLELISKCDLLKLNEDELTYVKSLFEIESSKEEEVLSHLAAETGVRTICVTLGEKGAMVYHHQHLYKHKGFEASVADTVGAGDAFLATFLSGLLKEFSIKETLSRACAAGALVASKSGANPDYSIEDISQIVLKNQQKTLKSSS